MEEIRLKKGFAHLLWRQGIMYCPWYFVGVCCLFLTHAIQSELPLMAKNLADQTLSQNESISLWPFVLLALGIIIFRTSSRLLFFYPARAMQRDMRTRLMSLWEETPPVRYKNFSDGQLFQLVVADMEQIRVLVGFALLQVGNMIVALSILVPKLSSFHPEFVTSLFPLVCAFGIFSLLVSTNAGLYKKMQNLQGDVQNFIIESYKAKATIAEFKAEEKFLSFFIERSYAELKVFFIAGLKMALAVPIVPLGIGLSLVWGSHLVFLHNMGPTSLILYSGFVFLLMEPMAYVSWIGVVIGRTWGSWQRIRENVEQVAMVHPSEKKILKNAKENLFDVEIPFWSKKVRMNVIPFQTLALVGQTGHGKSTVLEHFALHFKVTKAGALSMVFQNPYLFNDTVENNIFLGAGPSKKDRWKARRLLELFDLESLGESDQDTLNLEIGENGKRVSGGQAKRLALVRSLLGPSNIIIWDDPFSSVDIVLEKKIWEALLQDEIFKGRTLVFSTHRLTSARFADQIILLHKDHGIMEQGDSQRVLADKQGKIFEFFENQMV